jgi:hypothetical protein
VLAAAVVSVLLGMVAVTTAVPRSKLVADAVNTASVTTLKLLINFTVFVVPVSQSVDTSKTSFSLISYPIQS